jgi:hypothetical protein
MSAQKTNKALNALGKLLGNFLAACATAAIIGWLKPVGFWQLVLVLQLFPWAIALGVILIVGLVAVLKVD